jgi:hypothetical protein
MKRTERNDKLLMQISIGWQMEDDEMKAPLAERAVLAGEAEAPV